MPVTPTASDLLFTAIRESLAKEIDREKEEIIQEACKEFERRVRKATVLKAIDLVNVFSVERVGPDLVIRVKIETEKKS